MIFLFCTFPLHIAVSLAYSCIIFGFFYMHTACGLTLINFFLHKMRDFCIGNLNACFSQLVRIYLF